MNGRLCGAPTLLLVERADLKLHRCAECTFVSTSIAVGSPGAAYYADYYRSVHPSPKSRYDQWLRHAEARLLLITTPNLDGLSRRLRGFRWRVVSAEHLGYFTQGTLSAVLRRAGFRTVRVTSRSLDTAVWFGSRSRHPAPRFDLEASASVRKRV